ncbi:hypothetical protein [Streptomyces sp. SM14]|uniref:hypothetical protein n=1 Tax=Streptomyces sp. SM14 TaxID=1736045 RepID=UPI000CD4CBD0|nr:hypothetical protein [Streptomyces sp. SM14]
MSDQVIEGRVLGPDEQLPPGLVTDPAPGGTPPGEGPESRRERRARERAQARDQRARDRAQGPRRRVWFGKPGDTPPGGAPGPAGPPAGRRHPPAAPPPPSPARSSAPAAGPPPEIHVHITLGDQEQEHDRWAWLRARLWWPGTLLGAAAAFGPIPGIGYSVAQIWGSLCWYLRDVWAPGGFIAAIGLVVVALTSEARLPLPKPGVIPVGRTRALLFIAVVGGVGVVHPYDAIEIMTGVPL